MANPLSKDEIPVCESTEEKNKVWQECKSNNQPFVILEKVEQGYMPKYDLHTTDSNLTEDAANEAREWLEEWVEIYTEELKDTRFNREELSWHAGKGSGAIWPLEREEALTVAEELSKIVSDDSNLNEVTPRDAFYGGMN